MFYTRCTFGVHPSGCFVGCVQPAILFQSVVWTCVSLGCCRQVGLQLHELSTQLPLYDAETGQPVSQETDNRMERLRDTLMDDAREHVERMGEDQATGGRSTCRWRLHCRLGAVCGACPSPGRMGIMELTDDVCTDHASTASVLA